MKRHHGRTAEYEGDRLAIERLDRAYWRVSDPRSEDADPSQLLGFIERIGRSRFEVLWMTEPIAWAYVSSLAIALEAFADRERFAGIIEPERDKSVPIAHAGRLHRI
jgi:hypothetical protein